MSENPVKMEFKAEGDLREFVEALSHRVRELEATVEKAGDGLNKFDGVTKKLAATFSVAAIGLKSYQFAMKGVAEATGNMMASAKVEAIIAATGSAAGVTALQMQQMSAEMARNTTHTGSAIQEAQALLLTFREISGDVFPQAIGAIGDMAVMFGGLESAAMQVGKALNNPADGLAALTRAGVRFNDEQTELIKKLTEVGDVAGAQTVILKQLESQFGGVAKAIADTPAGKLQQLKNEFADIQAQLGERLIPALVEFQKIMNATTKFITEHGEVIAGVAVGAMVMMNAQIVIVTRSVIAMTAAMATNPLFLAATAVAVGVMAVGTAIKAMGYSAEDATPKIVALGESVEVAAGKEVIDNFLKLQKAAEGLLAGNARSAEPQITKDVKAVEAEFAETIEKIKKRIAELPPTPIKTVFFVDGKSAAIDESESLQKMLTDLETEKAAKINKIRKDANARNVQEYKDAMEQIRLAGLTEQEREVATLEKRVNAYKDAYKKMGKDTTDVINYETTQREAILKRYDDASAKAAEAELERVNRLQALCTSIVEQEAQKRKDIEQKYIDTVVAKELGKYEVSVRAVQSQAANMRSIYETGSAEHVKITQWETAQILQIRQEEAAEVQRIQETQVRDNEAAYLKMMEPIDRWGGAAASVINSIGSLFSNMNSNKMKEIDASAKKEIDAVNSSRMSNRAKAAEQERIEQEAAKAKLELAIKQWNLDKGLAVINAAAAVLKTMASTPYPLNIPLAIAQGVAGAVQVAIIEQNKPKMQFGGFVPGQSWNGDRVNILANSGEAVLTPAQQRNFMDMANGGGVSGERNVTIGDTHIIINGNADSSTVSMIGQALADHRREIVELLYDAERRGEIDHSRLAFA